MSVTGPPPAAAAWPTPRRLVCLGSILVDLVLDVPGLPPRGGDVLARQVAMTAGGGFNVASAAARLGLPTAYAGPHGTGPFGDRVRSALADEGVPALLPQRRGLDTGYCIALVEPDGERSFVTVAGADAAMTHDGLASLGYAPDDAVYASGYDLAYETSGPVLADHLAGLGPGPLLALDPGPLAGDIPLDRWAAVLPRVDLLSLNAREAHVLAGIPEQPAVDVLAVAATLAARLHGEGSVVVVRQGRLGATVLRDRAAPVVVAGYPVVAVDSTGAGDVHVGATLAGLATGLDVVAAVDLGNRAAAYSVTQRGGPTGPTREGLRGFSAPNPPDA